MTVRHRLHRLERALARDAAKRAELDRYEARFRAAILAHPGGPAILARLEELGAGGGRDALDEAIRNNPEAHELACRLLEIAGTAPWTNAELGASIDSKKGRAEP
jgi:hypothetical protein